MQGLQFSDKDEHMYFWFPLLAGLSELTFDPRPDIRYSALEVLFDTLKFHGSAFSLPFWTRIFDSVLLPIFDHVRAEVRMHAQPHLCTTFLQCNLGLMLHVRLFSSYQQRCDLQQ